ncbi:hypothetical protein [Nostoc sp. FACHB-857]|nr:hypothetical protein [Nostoc sp. FACHB-857]
MSDRSISIFRIRRSHCVMMGWFVYVSLLTHATRASDRAISDY